MKTPTIARVWEDLAAQARDRNWSHEEYLTAVLERQVADRESAGTVMRIRSEEKLLREQFGSEYEEYAREVPAFIPVRLRVAHGS